MTPEGGQRRDAVANRRAVIEAAAELLPENPDASMQEIADFTGLGRSTVYRHFPNREALFGAMTIEAVGTAVDQVGAILSSSTSTTRDTLSEMGEFLAGFGLRFRFLYSHREEARPALEAFARSPETQLAIYLSSAAERGDIRDDQPPVWLVSQFVALTISLVGDVIGGRLEREDAGALLGGTFVAMTEVRP
ncbi:MAG: TetR/AcrR family transcriptional regulator [Solirubrobacterales bacterium]